MADIRSVFRSRYVVWAILALPSAAHGRGPCHRRHNPAPAAARQRRNRGAVDDRGDDDHAAQDVVPKPRWLGWLVWQRRALGVAAFFYAAFHTVLYLVDLGTLHRIAADFWKLGIWTGWAAFFIFIPLAITSNDATGCQADQTILEGRCIAGSTPLQS